MADITIKTFEKGEIICKEGNFEMWMYEILNGRCGVYKSYGEADEEKLSEITEGYIGEMGLINCIRRSATVVALEKTELAVIDEDTFVSYFVGNSKKLSSIMVCLANRLNETNQLYLEACETVRDCLAADAENRKKNSALLRLIDKFAEAFSYSDINTRS